MAEMRPHEIESLRRSIAMLPFGTPSGLSRETALVVIGQLQAVTADRDRLLVEGDADRQS
ncbi:MAG TPA: hypothetical protein VKR27_01375 [Acidimicrobiales bacterium]|nr:hypothetical protein [Acidimicrobiales bacterium]